MRKKISLLILSNNGSPSRQLTFSSGFLRVFVLALIVLFSYASYDYCQLKRTSIQNMDREVRMVMQTDEIQAQRMQIQKFAKEINSLKSRLVKLNEFEKKIRIIANLEDKTGQDALFGVGGSIPEDLEAGIALEEKHNNLLRDMHEHVDQIDTASSKQNNSFDSLLSALKDQQTLLACTPAIRPTRGWVTSRFGYRISPFTGLREFHKGYDIACRQGTNIVAPADGVVVFTGNKGLLGKVIKIDHGYGMTTRYAHIDKALKKVGEKVARGEPIALVGNSGRSTGPHLHYEVHLNGLPVNPEKYILN
jgi:murein DD-endopeptidase MepM/ murein hydrolase activator NlpD